MVADIISFRDFSNLVENIKICVDKMATDTIIASISQCQGKYQANQDLGRKVETAFVSTFDK